MNQKIVSDELFKSLIFIKACLEDHIVNTESFREKNESLFYIREKMKECLELLDKHFEEV